MTDRPEDTGPETTDSQLSDSFGRRIKYLRISLTDRCNLKCTYCRPDNLGVKRHEDLLTFEEITGVVRVMVRLGINKIRLTGGEPLVRKDSERLVRMLSEIPDIGDMAMTTNAVLMDRLARPLAEAGLNRVNVSLDTLKPERFERLTGGNELKRVLKGIDAAVEAGLVPVKLNTVMMRGFNDDELSDIIDFAAERGFTVRFIECMPMRDGLKWDDVYISSEEMLKRPEIAERVDKGAVFDHGNAASFYLPLRSGPGEVGFITPMSKRFCDVCDRLRLTADGRLRSCLPTDKDIDIKEACRNGATTEEIASLVRKAVLLKPESGEYSFEESGRAKNMVEIGG